MPSKENWYIVKQTSNECKVVSDQELKTLATQAEETSSLTRWGPFETQDQAIAKRIGLIRSGKCQPVS